MDRRPVRKKFKFVSGDRFSRISRDLGWMEVDGDSRSCVSRKAPGPISNGVSSFTVADWPYHTTKQMYHNFPLTP